MSFLKTSLKRSAEKFGIDVMSLDHRQSIRTSTDRLIKEYLNLLAVSRNVDLPDDQLRIRLLSELVGTGIGEGSHLIACLAAVKDIQGDACEFGVGSGATSALIAHELKESSKILWLYDTFSGLPSPTPEDKLIDDIDHLGSMAAYEGKMRHPETEVRSRLSRGGIPASKFKIIPGLFSEKAPVEHLPQRVSFAYVDFDFYAPIRAALHRLAPLVAPGGIVVVDDYGFFSSGAQHAVDEFLGAHPGLFNIELPTHCADKFAILYKREWAT